MQLRSIVDFLKDSYPIIDVRSPAEHAHGHIPGAHSLPLFSNEERTEIGTLYKHDGKQVALKRGLDIVGPKLRSYVETAEQLGSKQLGIHCWRGGMRSQSMAWLLSNYGFNITVLEGGYKAYRRHQSTLFEAPWTFKVVTGNTGSKKTLILSALGRSGEQVIDLEGLANHQGSSFGNVLSSGQPSTEHFQNMLFEKLRRLDISRPVWIEDESMMIGHCMVPRALYERKEVGAHYLIELPLTERLEHLVSDYGQVAPQRLSQATEGIRKRLGHQRCDEAIAAIEAGEPRAATALILHYYDKMYQRCLDKKQVKHIAHCSFAHGDVEQIAKALIDGDTGR